MATTNIVLPITMTNIASGSISGTYAAINSTGLPFPCWEIIITNTSNKDVTVSLDGTTDHFFVTSGTILTLITQTNSRPNNFVDDFAQGTRVWVKGAAGAGTGNVYLSGLYQPTQT